MFLTSLYFANSIFYSYLCGMDLANNIKKIREERGLKQIDVASHIGVDKSAYSKIEKWLRNVAAGRTSKNGKSF